MSGSILIVIGLLLCFFGAASIRAGIVIAGLGLGHFLAEVFHASPQVVILTACGGAVIAFLCALLIAHFMLFISGVCVGAVVGVKIFVLIGGGGHDWPLALIVVPAIALIGGVLANWRRKPFLRWATAFSGAALVLSGLGRMDAEFLRNLWRPQTLVGSIVLVVSWIVLTGLGHQVQARRFHTKRTEPAG